ncbi:uncharacterized protein LOC122405154 [Colletes gigas]|uniref:uncharacterized protein LOC122405154 n=1 Tax=Colletes gigas TaxID=935657 RepID=UPI001C9BB406|nr:uncharacterized protein LOC122405154 [Colletes gigas]
MVKMAHALLPNLRNSISASNMCPTNFTPSTALSDVLNSEPVKRLFNQPNIVIKTIPSKARATSASYNNNVGNEAYNLDSNVNTSKLSELSIVPLPIDQEEENLLPSKKEGKSEIALVPIKRVKKSCGHYEPCENIVCEVSVQQYVDRDGASPMLAVHIEEDEINAPVSKHCANAKCDALSIDHDRCRRAVIRLNRCNRSTACDICGIELQTRRCRVHHKNCKRKTEYRHNETSGAQVLKERMREREIQLIAASKAKKNNYMDLGTVMEMLKNNEELIIIPKSVTAEQPTGAVTTVATTQTAQVNSMYNVFGKLLPSIPIVLPQQSIVLGKSQSSNENDTTIPVNVVLPDTLNRPVVTTTSAASLPQSQFVTFATHHNAQPLTLNDLLFSQSSLVTSSAAQPTPLLTPIRVVPITNLITEPSLLHQTQGIPKFCIIADPPVPIPVSAPLQVPVSTPSSLTVSRITKRLNSVPKVNTPSVSKRTLQKKKKKRKHKKKEFKCEYCLKCFSTEWYFKVHVAKHSDVKQFPCKICTACYTNEDDLESHMLNDHTRKKKSDSAHNQKSNEQPYNCLDCNTVYKSVIHLKRHRQKYHGRTVCSLCQSEILIEELERHIATEHKKRNKIVKIKEETVENGDTSDGKNEVKFTSNILERKINNINRKTEIMEGRDQNMNGYDSISDGLNISNAKVELNYAV